MMRETAEGAIQTALGALGVPVYNTLAPTETRTPYIVWNLVSGIDDEYTLAGRIRSAALYDVRVYGPAGDKEALLTLLEDIDDALMDLSGLFYIRRERYLPDLAETIGGEVWLQVGATYRVEVEG